MDTTKLVNGFVAPVIDAKGRKRGTKTYIVCPVCEQGRWIRSDVSRRPLFTGMCQKCHAKFTTGQGETHSRWRGGKINKAGYVKIYVKPDDFFFPMADNHNRIFEHRLVMARHLRRCLFPWEIVHHKNNIRNDNRLENLQILPGKQYHVVDSATKALIKHQEALIHKLQNQITLLGYAKTEEIRKE